ncbi:putative transmemrbane protein [Rhizobium johnstonii 3841]|uniref:Transmemrbane protein n=2 Tax=Rhizobium/Agrobacterium group TaxID=227290 RepID=Q1MIU8_RHIJ3|nr:putative transmemrbane protein [Rhizobium johnstonii 3841]
MAAAEEPLAHDADNRNRFFGGTRKLKVIKRSPARLVRHAAFFMKMQPQTDVCAMETDSPTIPKRTLADILFILFLRLVAISCFWFGLQYWAMLVGYSLVGAGRFDLLSLPWKVASTSLAVLFPVASLGLWLTVSWGPVIWVLAAGGQVLMYGLLPDIFGPNQMIILLHVMVAAVYLIFRLLLWLEKRRHRRQVSVDLP